MSSIAEARAASAHGGWPAFSTRVVFYTSFVSVIIRWRTAVQGKGERRGKTNG